MLNIATFVTGPMSAPPHFESENAHEPDSSELAYGNHVAAAWLVGIKPHETTDGVWSGGYVWRDMSKNWVVIRYESWAFEFNGGWGVMVGEHRFFMWS